MPKLTGLSDIINSANMKLSHRILTTEMQWPDGDAPFSVGKRVHIPNPPSSANETVIYLPETLTFSQATQNSQVMDTFRNYIDADLNTTGLDVICIGDSIFEGCYCGEDYYSDNWSYKLRDILQSRYNPYGVGGLGYVPFSFGAIDTVKDVWNTRYPGAIPENRILWDSQGNVCHSWEADFAFGMWTRETAARGIFMSPEKISTWASSTTYVLREIAKNGTNVYGYRCILEHTSSATDEPGVGVNWETYWERTVPSWILGGGYAIGNIVENESLTERYICILDHNAATTDEPGVGVNWQTYWRAAKTTMLGGDGKIKHTFTGKTSGVQLIAMTYPPPYDVHAWIDFNSTNAYVAFEAGNLGHADQTIPHTEEPELSYEPDTYGGYSYGYHLPQVTLASPTSNVTVQIGSKAYVNLLVASGLVHYNGDYAQGIRLHNFATSGNWASVEADRLQQNVTRWCTQTGGATNARLFICNMITNDYLFQGNQVAWEAWRAEHPNMDPLDPEYMYNPEITLPTNPEHYARLMDQIITANTNPMILWVIPPKPVFGGVTETYTYQQYCDMIYTLAASRPQVAILDMWKAVQYVERTALTNGWSDIDNTHFTPIWHEAIAEIIADMIMYKWTDVTNIVSDYHITQDGSMHIDAASLSVPLGWRSSLANVFREMRVVCIQERYSDGSNTTDWVNAFWGISDGYSETWSGNNHNYIVNLKNALKLANIEYLGAKTGNVVYQADSIAVGSNATHYQMTWVNTAADAYEFGITATPGNSNTAVHPNWADKPEPQFWCSNARDKDGNATGVLVPLSAGGSAVNAVFGEGILRIGLNWARTTSKSGDITNYAQGLGLGYSEIPQIECILYRFAHPLAVEAVSFRTPLTVPSDITENLTVISSSAGQVVLSSAIPTHAISLILEDGTGRHYNTTTTGTTTATIALTNTSAVIPVGTAVTYGDANKLTTVIPKMLLDCGYQQLDSNAPLYINKPEIPIIAGESEDLVLPPLIYNDTDKVLPVEAIDTLRQGGFIPPNYVVYAGDNGQIYGKSVSQLATGNSAIIEAPVILASPGMQYDRNDLDVRTRVVSRGVIRQVADYTQLSGVTIADVSEANGGLPYPATALDGQALRYGGWAPPNYQWNLSALFQRNYPVSASGYDCRPWGWYVEDGNPELLIPIGTTLYNQWCNKVLAEITLVDPVNISAIEFWTPNPWATDQNDWGGKYHYTNIYDYANKSIPGKLWKKCHMDAQTISIEYYDIEQECWMPLISNRYCAITMDPNYYVHRIESKDFSSRGEVIAQKLRIVCISPFFAEHGDGHAYGHYNGTFAVYMTQFKVWGSSEIRGTAELGNASNYGGELSESPWPEILKRIRKRTHVLDEAVPWVSDNVRANWLALEWLKRMVRDLAPRKLSVMQPDIRVWDTINITAPGGVPIDYLVTSTDRGSDGVTNLTAVSYTYPYFDDNNDNPWFDTWSDTNRWNDSVYWKK